MSGGSYCMMHSAFAEGGGTGFSARRRSSRARADDLWASTEELCGLVAGVASTPWSRERVVTAGDEAGLSVSRASAWIFASLLQLRRRRSRAEPVVLRCSGGEEGFFAGPFAMVFCSSAYGSTV